MLQPHIYALFGRRTRTHETNKFPYWWVRLLRLNPTVCGLVASAKNSVSFRVSSSYCVQSYRAKRCGCIIIWLINCGPDVCHQSGGCVCVHQIELIDITKIHTNTHPTGKCIICLVWRRSSYLGSFGIVFQPARMNENPARNVYACRWVHRSRMSGLLLTYINKLYTRRTCRWAVRLTNRQIGCWSAVRHFEDDGAARWSLVDHTYNTKSFSNRQ